MTKTLQLIKNYVNEHNIEIMHAQTPVEYLYIYTTAYYLYIYNNEHNIHITNSTSPTIFTIDLTNPNSLQQLLVEITKHLNYEPNT